MDDLGERFLACFVLALDDAELPDDPAFRDAMRAYMRWAVDNVLSYSPERRSRPGARGNAALGLERPRATLSQT